MSLCYRCEHRARFLETGRGPRWECQQPERSVSGCYMYQPVRPVVLKRNKGDKRPQFGPWMVSARSSFVRLWDEAVLHVSKRKDGNAIYWAPKRRRAK